jgi:hypothetical protein
LHPSRGFDQQQGPHTLHALVNVDLTHLGQRARAEQAVRQIAQTVGFFNDDVGVFADVGAGRRFFQQLGRPANATQWILDFVGHAPDEGASSLMIGDLRFFP